MSPEALNKATVRRLLEEVFGVGNVAVLDHLVTPDVLDHDPMPGQPAGIAGIRYVLSTLRGARPDMRVAVEDLVAEGDRVAARWTLSGTDTGGMFGEPPTGAWAEERLIVVFRLNDGMVVERWAAFGR